jgi:hypothetical protein
MSLHGSIAKQIPIWNQDLCTPCYLFSTTEILMPILRSMKWRIGWINALSPKTHVHRAIVATLFTADHSGALPIYLASLQGFSFIPLFPLIDASGPANALVHLRYTAILTWVEMERVFESAK